MQDTTYLKNFIKFLTFGYYFITKLNQTEYFRYIEINYSTALHRVELGFVRAGLDPEFDTIYLNINYNKFDIAPLDLLTFTKRKKGNIK